MLIDDGDGSTPQFISDDHEVEVYVQMRRKIEEVNLFVTIAQCVDGVTTAPPKAHVANVKGQTFGTLEDAKNDTNDVATEDEWMEFAMSETPLTRPPIANAVGGNFRAVVRETIPSRSNGIVIRENQPIIRLRSPPPCEGNRGKGKAILREHDSGSQNGRRYGGNGVSPDATISEDGEPSRGVKRRLFSTEGIEEDVDMVAEASDGTSVQAPIPVAEPVVSVGEESAGLTHWSRFQDALHEILDDETSQNVLFGRDAPPVIKNSEKDGTLSNIPYYIIVKYSTTCTNLSEVTLSNFIRRDRGCAGGSAVRRRSSECGAGVQVQKRLQDKNCNSCNQSEVSFQNKEVDTNLHGTYMRCN